MRGCEESGVETIGGSCTGGAIQEDVFCRKVMPEGRKQHFSAAAAVGPARHHGAGDTIGCVVGCASEIEIMF